MLREIKYTWDGSPSTLESAKFKVLQDTLDLISQLLVGELSREPKPDIPSQYCGLVQQLAKIRYWGVIQLLDGNPTMLPFNQNLPYTNYEATATAQRWSSKHFSKYGLHKILEVVVNQALVNPMSHSQPGNNHGHMSLYRFLFGKQRSIFSNSLTPEFRQKLNQGRFWEALGEGNGMHLYDVLNNPTSLEDLDYNFAIEGLRLTKKLNGSNRDIKSSALQFLGADIMQTYADFMFKIREHNAIPGTEIKWLTKPFVQASLSWDTSSNEPYFNSDLTYVKLLNHPLVLSSLRDGRNNIGGVITEQIAIGLGHHDRESYFKFVNKIVEGVPSIGFVKRSLGRALAPELLEEAVDTE